MLSAFLLYFLPSLVFAADIAATKSSGIPSWVGWVVAPLFLPIIWPLVKRQVVNFVVGQFLAAIHAALEKGDDDDDALTLALVHWLERKAEKCGATGPERFKAVAADLCSRVKPLKGREEAVAELLQAVVKGVEQAAEKVEGEQKPPTVPPKA